MPGPRLREGTRRPRGPRGHIPDETRPGLGPPPASCASSVGCAPREAQTHVAPPAPASAVASPMAQSNSETLLTVTAEGSALYVKTPGTRPEACAA